MPPISPQGSRGGLIAAVVVFTILFVTSTIFAIYFGVQGQKKEEELKTLQDRSREIAIDTVSPEVDALRRLAKEDHALPEPTALAEAMRQREELRKMIVGSQLASTTQPVDASAKGDVTDTLSKAVTAVGQANAILAQGGQKLAADSLVQSIAALTVELRNVSRQVDAARADRDAARAEAEKTAQTAREAQDKANTTVTENTQTLTQKVDAANDAVKKAQGETEAARKTFEAEQAAAAAAAAASDNKVVAMNKQIDSLTAEIEHLRGRLDRIRQPVEDPIVRRTQGQIIRVADNDTVYINLGRGDQIVQGMTFEVYDKTLPLPKLGNGLVDDNMPVGKGSIEVVRILGDSSECHVTKTEAGAQFVEGDPILNLVYDRNTKYNFYVYGDFDTTRVSKPTAAGADVIKRLVAQWGGHVSNNLDVNTDFVVMGAPPEVPVFTPEELKDPNNQLALANAKEASNKYDDVIKKAQELHIPIMNQNRFLYFTGYYDVAQR